MTGRVLIVGSINLDETIRMARLPGPGETVTARNVTSSMGGKGANQAVAAARAGARVAMVGAISATDTRLVPALTADGIDTTAVGRIPDMDSGRAVVYVDDAAENSIVVIPGTNHRIPEESVEKAVASLVSGDVLVLQNEIDPATSRLAARRARTAGATVLWNAAPAPTSREEVVDDVDVLIVNEHELGVIARLLDVEHDRPASSVDDVEVLIAAVSRRTGADVVCTLGSRGAAYLIGGRPGHADTRGVDAVDTTAAGDTFVGYLAATTHLPLAERIQTALAAGTLTVTRPGAASSIPTLAEVRDTLNASQHERSTV